VAAVVASVVAARSNSTRRKNSVPRRSVVVKEVRVHNEQSTVSAHWNGLSIVIELVGSGLESIL
jgi:hypothetical protein